MNEVNNGTKTGKLKNVQYWNQAKQANKQKKRDLSSEFSFWFLFCSLSDIVVLFYSFKVTSV